MALHRPFEMSSIQNQFLIPFRKRAKSKQMQRTMFLLWPGLLFASLIRPINRTALKILVKFVVRPVNVLFPEEVDFIYRPEFDFCEKMWYF